MGEKFELEIAVKSIDIPKLLSCFKEYDFCKISSIDNWDYDNETKLHPNEAGHVVPADRIIGFLESL